MGLGMPIAILLLAAATVSIVSFTAGLLIGCPSGTEHRRSCPLEVCQADFEPTSSC